MDAEVQVIFASVVVEVVPGGGVHALETMMFVDMAVFASPNIVCAPSLLLGVQVG